MLGRFPGLNQYQAMILTLTYLRQCQHHCLVLVNIFSVMSGRFPGLNQYFSNDVDLTYLRQGQNVGTVFFSETIAACDLKVGRCRQLIDFI